MVVVHIDTSTVRVRVTCEFYSYEQFLDRSRFYQTRRVMSTTQIWINLTYIRHDALAISRHKIASLFNYSLA